MFKALDIISFDFTTHTFNLNTFLHLSDFLSHLLHLYCILLFLGLIELKNLTLLNYLLLLSPHQFLELHFSFHNILLIVLFALR